MGLASKKRPHPGTSSGAVKKHRTQPVAKKPAAKAKRSMGINQLRWKAAKIPDMFEDAEGFYGLEEVDDVEIVRNADNTVEFRTAAAAADEPDDGEDDDALAADETDDGEDSDSFEGFDDQPQASSESTVGSKTTGSKGNNGSGGKEQAKASSKDQGRAKKQGKGLDKKDEKQKSKTTTTQAKDDIKLESDVFGALEDGDDAEDEADVSAWAGLHLSPPLLSSLAKLKFSDPTPIQAAAIPHIQAGHDVIGKASTGSGKTLAFAIPIVEKWLEDSDATDSSTPPAGPLALVLSPTRELAHQLEDHIKDLCRGLPNSPYVCAVTGGLSVHKQQRQLNKADIVVGTPGRLWEVLSSSPGLLAKFKAIGFLVVDEADRLLTDGHFKEAEEIFKALDRYAADEDDEEREASARQTLVFSATFHKGLQQKLMGRGKWGLMDQGDSMEYLLRKLKFREEKPKYIDVNPVSQMAEGLQEGLVECGAMEKDLYLYTLLLMYPRARTLVFTNAIGTARRITPMLQNLSLAAHALHSQMPQKARLRSIERFTATRPGEASVLIATDVASRGLDIPGVDMVIHYHVPRAADAYVHRSGRTARAEKSGLSILLCAPDEVVPTRRLIVKVHSQRQGAGKSLFVQTVDLDRRLASRLKPRLTLAKKIADAILAKEKGSKEGDWMRNAAEELGVEYDTDEMAQASKWGGRGSGRKEKQDAAQATTKAELGAMRAELKQLLAKRVNAGVSEKYITSGLVDVHELLRGAKGDFLGKVDGLNIQRL